MYQVGELIVYGSTGVCEVMDIITLDGMKDVPKGQLHYKLRPLYESCEIFTPVENPGSYLRPVMSAREAEELVARIPQIQAVPFPGGSLQQLKDHYRRFLDSHSSEDLLALARTLYDKKRTKKFNQVDDTYMKRVETLLFGELSVALNIPKEQLQPYIAGKLESLPQTDEG